MIDHVWSVLCQTSIIDRDTNLFSIINVIEELSIVDEPNPEKVLNAPIQVASLWVRTEFDQPGQAEALYTFVAPSGNIVWEKKIKIDLSEYERLRGRVLFGNLPLDGSGKYLFCVDLRSEDTAEWVRVASIPLKVNFKPENKAREATEPQKSKETKK